MDERTGRTELVAAMRRLDELGLNQNSSGNVGVRTERGLLVSPTGMPADRIGADDAVLLDGSGRPVGGRRAPTSEWRLHAAIAVRRPEIGAIVHTHSPEATAAAALRSAIPAVHYVAARFGTGGLRCAPYATYGTEDLATNVTGTLGSDAMACLMANHGAIALGADLDQAVALALDVEWFCGVFRRAGQLGDPVVLDDEEIGRVARRFESYGQPG